MARRFTEYEKQSMTHSALRSAVNDHLEPKTGRTTKQVEDAVKLAASWKVGIATLFSRVASVVAGRSIKCLWVDGIDVGATDGADIFLSNTWYNWYILPAVINKKLHLGNNMAEVKGLVYHELAHILWTPRKNSNPTKHIPVENWQAYNALEDQRIESLFVARYRPAIPFFTSMVAAYILEMRGKSGYSATSQTCAPSMAHLLTHGRKFMPLPLRAAARASFVAEYGEGLADRAEDIIDSYRKLTFPNDSSMAIELVARYQALVDELNADIPEHQPVGSPVSSTQGHKGHKRGRPENASSQRDDAEKLEDFDKETEQEERELSEERSGDSHTSDRDSAGADKDDDLVLDDGSKSDGSGSSEISSDQDGVGEVAGNAGDNGAGTVNEETSSSDSDEAIEALRDAAVETRIDADNQTKSDADASVKTVAAEVAKANSHLGKPQVGNRKIVHRTYPAGIGLKTQAIRLQDYVRRVFTECEEDWVRDQASGRLNVTDAMQSRNRHFDVFERFEDASDDISFEIVVLVDRSASMNARIESNESYYMSRAEAASRATWVLRKACAELDIPITVIAFSSWTDLVHGANEVAGAGEDVAVVDADGGTDPYDAIKWGHSILTESDASNRLLVTITDGEWGTQYEGAAGTYVMNTIATNGIQSMLVQVSDDDPYGTGSNYDYYEAPNGKYHGHQSLVKIDSSNLNRLPDLVGKQITRLANELVRV
jgi:hypothetical protein